MDENERTSVETDNAPDEKWQGARTPRAIRFAESEWQEVKMGAVERGISAAEFVRSAALALARSPKVADSATIVPGIAALIERIYRSTYIVATLKRDEMRREGRGDEMDEIIKAARETQATILRDASE